MEEVTHLIIKVSSDDVGRANKELEKLGWTAEKADGATKGLTKASDGLAGTFKRMLGPLLGLVSVTAGLTKLVQTTRQFEVLEASLKTATGSAESAKVAFEALQDFAQETPYDLAQTTEAFIKLVNLGLTPSERALRSYGNTAASMSQDLSTLVQAVARAVTGEYEPLKTFGIGARKEADGIAFTFRGVTEKVENSTKAIEGYFIRLGEKNFAGAMTERMKTLDGAISNLGDAWDVLFATIGKAGTGQLIQQGIRMATDAIVELTDMVASGQLQGYIDAIGLKFTGVADDIAMSWSALTDLIQGVFSSVSTEGFNAGDKVKRAFTEMPENIRAAMRLIGATLGGIYEVGETVSKGLREAFIGAFLAVAKVAIRTGEEIYAAMNPFDKLKPDLAKYVGDVQTIYASFATNTKENLGKVGTSLGQINEAWEETVTQVLNDRDATVKASEDKIAASKRLREEYDKNKAARLAAAKGTDRLAPFSKASDTRNVGEEERHRYEALKASLQLEETSIQESYQKRLKLIQDNTTEGTDLRLELEKSLNQQVSDEYEKAFQSRKSRVLSLEEELRKAVAEGRTSDADAISFQLQSEEERIAASYEQRRQMILSDTQTTEEEKLKLLADLNRKYGEQEDALNRARRKATLSQVADFYGNISTIASAFGKKGAKIAKAAAIVQATIKTYESATSAYASLAGIPYVGPALGAAAAGAAIAAGMANVAAIKSQEYSGAYDTGGMIPGGTWGIAGEYGPEMIKGPAIVTSRQTTRDKGLAGGGGDGSNVVINLINQAPGIVVEKTGERDTDNGKIIDMVVRRAKAELTKDVEQGSGSFTKAMERTYGVKRGAAA